MKRMTNFQNFKAFIKMTKRQSNTIRLNDVVCHYYYVDNGKKETIVFVHGFGSSHLVYSSVSELLQDYNIVLISLPGFSNTKIETHVNPTVEWYGKTVSDVINVLPVKVDHIVLHSFSTMYAQMLSSKIKNEIKTITLAGFVTPKIADPKNFMNLRRVIYLTKKQHAEWIEFLYHDKLPRWFIAIARRRAIAFQWKNFKHSVNVVMQNIAYFELHKNINTYIPKLNNLYIMRGKSDRLTTEDMQKSVEAHLGTRKRTYLIDECGHNPFFERPVETAKILREIFNHGYKKKV